MREKTIQRLRSRGIDTDGTRESLHALGIEEEVFDPHITLGEVDLDKPQPDMVAIRERLRALEGKTIDVSGLVIFFYKKENDAARAELVN